MRTKTLFTFFLLTRRKGADVASIMSIVYSLGPSVVNLIMPIVAENVFHTNQTDIRVYRLVFPILGILGSALLVIVYANTKEKIIQAKTHVIQIKFTDAFKAVAKNKYFWIISLASWIGFLELLIQIFLLGFITTAALVRVMFTVLS